MALHILPLLSRTVQPCLRLRPFWVMHPVAVFLFPQPCGWLNWLQKASLLGFFWTRFAFGLGTVAALLLFRAFEMDWTTILSNLAALMGVSLLAVAEVTVAGAWLGAALAPEPLFSFCLVVLSHLTMISS